MKVGDYVRTKDGGIRKIIGLELTLDGDYNYYIDEPYMNRFGQIVTCIDKNCIIGNPCPNIIDLIEVGDYVNGYKVSFVDEEPVMGKFVQCDYEVSFGTTNHYRFYEADIKSIVTKEQFESMEYKVYEEGK